MSNNISSYNIRDFRVYFGNQYVPNARWSDFQDLGQGYGKDSQCVFFMGETIEEADPYSFQILNDNYARDHSHVFYYGHILENVPSHVLQSNNIPSTNLIYPVQTETNLCMSMNELTTSAPSYVIHDFKVFFGDQYISEARWIDFTSLGHGYGKDIHHVFYMGHMIPDAHSFSFEVLTKGYAKDKNHVYYNGQIIPSLQPIGFQAPQSSNSRY